MNSMKRLSAAVLLCLGIGVQAHHSASAYDLSRVASQQGVLTQIRFENPHVRFLLAVMNESGITTQWDIEAAPPGWFRRAGILKSDLQKGVGSKVTIEMHPAKDGSPTGFFQMITFADGKFVRFSDVVKP